MMLTMLVDLDHLLANPIYDPNRCSIGFHPLHSYIAIAGYLVMGIFPKTRVIAYGLLIHMALDWTLLHPARVVEARDAKPLTNWAFNPGF